MKVLIPVAGMGSKLRPHTHTQPKALLPIAGKPILAHIIESLIEVGVKDFIFVIGYLGDKIENYIKENYKNINSHFVIQAPREGLAHAIWLCKTCIENEEQLLIVLGDTIVNLDLKTFLAAEHSVVGVRKVDTPHLFGIAQLDKEGNIEKLIEKPKIPKSNLALVGIYKINSIKKLLNAIEYMMDNQIKTQDEYHLTDALMKMIQDGEVINTILVDNWYDCGRKESLLEANAIWLNRDEFKKHKHYDFPNSIIIPPVSIGEGCQIKDSIVGPNVAIGDNTIIQSAIVENSIVGSYSELDCIVLRNSIVGNDSSVKGASHNLNIGDNTEINLGK